VSSTDEWQLVLPWEPWAKMRPRISAAVKGKARRTHQKPEDKDAEDRTREFLREHWRWPILEGNVKVSGFWFRSTRQTVDLDNLLKHFLDAATGIVFVNDCQVTAYGVMELHLDRDAPRSHVWVEPHDDASLLRAYDATTGKVRI
jgi:Holliday junction resolvase RusA-like endonuclease